MKENIRFLIIGAGVSAAACIGFMLSHSPDPVVVVQSKDARKELYKELDSLKLKYEQVEQLTEQAIENYKRDSAGFVLQIRAKDQQIKTLQKRINEINLKGYSSIRLDSIRRHYLRSAE